MSCNIVNPSYRSMTASPRLTSAIGDVYLTKNEKPWSRRSLPGGNPETGDRDQKQRQTLEDMPGKVDQYAATDGVGANERHCQFQHHHKLHGAHKVEHGQQRTGIFQKRALMTSGSASGMSNRPLAMVPGMKMSSAMTAGIMIGSSSSGPCWYW